MKSRMLSIALVAFSLTFLSADFVSAQAFYPHHPPQPPPPPQHQPPPSRPTQIRPQIPTPPPRMERMRPPTTVEKKTAPKLSDAIDFGVEKTDEGLEFMKQWRDEVADSIRGLANEWFGFDDEDESTVLDIEDYSGELNTNNLDFLDHDYVATKYKVGEPAEEYGGYFREPNVMAFEGPVYTLETLPEAAKSILDWDDEGNLFYRPIDFSDDPDTKYAIYCCSSDGRGIQVLKLKEVAPGIYERLSYGIDLYQRGYQSFTDKNGVFHESGVQWKDVVMPSGSAMKEVKKESRTFNVQDLASTIPKQENEQPPSQPEQKTKQPQNTEKTKGKKKPDTPVPTASPEPVEPEITVKDFQEITSDQTHEGFIPVHSEEPIPTTTNTLPEKFDEMGMDGPVVKEPDAERPTEPKGPTITDILQLEEKQRNDKWDKILEQGRPKVVIPDKDKQFLDDVIAGLQKKIDINASSGDVIMDDMDQATQDMIIKLVGDTAVDVGGLAVDAGIIYVSVQFPVVGLAIAGAQGVKAGVDHSIKNGGTTSETVLNGVVGGVTNATLGHLGNKIGGAGKLKVIGKTGGKVWGKIIDYGGAVVFGKVGGEVTDGMTGYGEPIQNIEPNYGTPEGGLQLVGEAYRDK